MFDHLDKGRWWDVGLQLVEGCTKVSPGCDNCWSLTAANMRRFNPNPKTAARYAGAVQYSQSKPIVTDTVSHYTGPPQWTGRVNPQWADLDKIGRSRTPKVYTFWNDLFHPGVPEEFIDGVLHRIQKNYPHFYIICTKRPERARDMFIRGCVSPDAVHAWNLMIMTTAENQEMADLRIPALLQIPGVLHGVSVEPGLSAVSLRWLGKIKEGLNTEYDGLRKFDWVICGGETGPHARPMHPDIPRKLRDQCQAAGVPFFFKAWGEWAPVAPIYDNTSAYADGQFDDRIAAAIEKRCQIVDLNGHLWPEFQPPPGSWMVEKVGKKASGRLLDGRTWDEVPLIPETYNLEPGT